MIAKKIHYVWLGGNPLPEIAKKCIESWKKFCPDYEICCHDETNLNLDKYKFARDAYDAKKFAFASDVFRTEILYNEGGVQFDIDVELIKPIDDLLEGKSLIVGFESSLLLNPGVFMAAEKGNEHLKNILDGYLTREFDVNNLTALTVCEVYTASFERLGLKRQDITQTIDDAIFYQSQYFSPIDVITSKKKITSKTRSIHWYTASWYSPKQKTLAKLKKTVNILTFGLAGKVLKKLRERKNGK